MTSIVLVTCGSFNPPTKAHIWMYEVAKEHLTKVGFDVLGGYLSPVGDYYKKPSLIPAHHRVKMCQRVVEGRSDLLVDDWESSQRRFVNTIHVLQHFINIEYFASCQFKTMLLCGADLILSFLEPGVWHWNHVEQILRDHGVVCVLRGENKLERELQDPNSRLFPFNKYIHIVSPQNLSTISSTKVRERIQSGKTIRNLVDKTVEDYINKNGLYLKC
eukprot:g4750.t1